MKKCNLGVNRNTIKNIYKEQEIEDMLQDKRSTKEYKDPLMGKYESQRQLAD